MSEKSEDYLSVVAGIMLLLAIPPIWPYAYFQILRWVVAGIALYNAHTAYNTKKNMWFIIMGIIAILFNPIAPIFLKKETWVILDIVTALFMFVSVKSLKNSN